MMLGGTDYQVSLLSEPTEAFLLNTYLSEDY